MVPAMSSTTATGLGRQCLFAPQRAERASRPARSRVQVRAQLKTKLPAVSTLEAWYMNDDTEEQSDQRTERRRSPNKSASAKIESLGVLSWKLDADNHESDPELAAIREDRGYTFDDIIDISPDKIPGYEEKIKKFFGEHLHAAEEIRLILEGSGYFDIRDDKDEWIRINTEKNDMIILPEGIYHRFTLDANNRLKAMRFFKGDPDWTNFIRPQDQHASREKYIQLYGAS